MCYSNYSGARCNESISHKNCDENGTLDENSQTCVCKEGYSGTICDLCDTGFTKSSNDDCIGEFYYIKNIFH